MLYLSACALNGTKPNAERVASMDLEKLYSMCRFHSLTSIVASALETVLPNIPAKWTEAKVKALRKTILLTAERQNLCKFMEDNHIWYMPLKGVFLQELYPELGMRQMADNDILFDAEYQKQICDFMVENGYAVKSYGKGNHDVYTKPPVYNFEMHTSLFNQYGRVQFHDYYKDVREKLVQDSDGSFGYHFTDEDFYIYITAHEYKHYSGGGTGLRSLMDSFVYNRAKGGAMDHEYIEAEFEKLGIADFARESLELSQKIFTDPDCTSLSEEERTMLEYVLFSGTYGTTENKVSKQLEKYEGRFVKVRYIFRRIFPDISVYKISYPFFYRHKWLLPVGWAYRLLRGLFCKRKMIRTELTIMNKLEK